MTVTLNNVPGGRFYGEAPQADGPAGPAPFVVSPQNSHTLEPDGDADFFANQDTRSVITVGGSVAGSIFDADDLDFHRVTLEAGKTYRIDMRGLETGDGTLVDPWILRVLDSDGVWLADGWDDDGGAGYNSAFLLTVPADGDYYIVASTAYGDEDGDRSGTYVMSVADVSDQYVGPLPFGPTNAESYPNVEMVGLSGHQYADGVLFGTRYVADEDGVTTTVTFSVPANNTYFSDFFYPEGEETDVGFAPVSAAEAAVFRSVLGEISGIANITFVEVAEADLSAGQIRIARTGLESESIAWAYLPGTSPVAGDVWLSTENDFSSVADNYLGTLIRHEVGHAMGLKHTFDEDNGFSAIAATFDSNEWSVMAYNVSAEHPNARDADLFPQTFMYADFVALRYLYGETPIATGNDTYTFADGARHYLTLWDDGGTDTLSVAGNSTDAVLSLVPGTWSDVGTVVTFFNGIGNAVGTREATIFIPFEVTIENATGGNGDDRLVGNDVANVLIGGNGNDTLVGGDGADELLGGGGNDQAWAGAGDTGNDTVDGGAGDDTIGAGAGDDQIIGGTGADVLFGGSGDDRITTDDGSGTGSAADVAWAGSGDDTITAGAGNDTLGGGLDADNISAGAGDDVLYGGKGEGQDTLSGGSGDDTVFSGAGNDSINGGGGGDLLFNGAGIDTVKGGSGNDTLWGGGGDDQMTGGGGADTFAFAGGNGNDTVTDFTLGEDILELVETATDFTDAASVTAAASDTADGLLIDTGGGDSVLLAGLTVADIGAMDLVL